MTPKELIARAQLAEVERERDELRSNVDDLLLDKRALQARLGQYEAQYAAINQEWRDERYERARMERDTARAQVETLTRELEQSRRIAQTFAGGVVKAAADLDDVGRLRAQVETLAEALRWYADDGAYKERTFKEDGVFKSMTPAMKDTGNRARAALKAARVGP